MSMEQLTIGEQSIYSPVVVYHKGFTPQVLHAVGFSNGGDGEICWNFVLKLFRNKNNLLKQIY